jgi:hypothetical protein
MDLTKTIADLYSLINSEVLSGEVLSSKVMSG